MILSFSGLGSRIADLHSAFGDCELVPPSIHDSRFTIHNFRLRTYHLPFTTDRRSSIAVRTVRRFTVYRLQFTGAR
jgi:hypothetical protein